MYPHEDSETSCKIVLTKNFDISDRLHGFDALSDGDGILGVATDVAPIVVFGRCESQMTDRIGRIGILSKQTKKKKQE